MEQEKIYTENDKRAKLKHVLGAMKQRCYNPKSEHYHYYGGRGISICDEWRFVRGAFIDWAMQNSYQPGLQIDRIDNNGNYEPDNCRFVTISKNAQNTRKNILITVNKRTECISEWARVIGVSTPTICSQYVKGGFEGTVAYITQKLNGTYRKPQEKLLTVNGQTLNLAAWSRNLGYEASTARFWLRKHGKEYTINRIENYLLKQ